MSDEKSRPDCGGQFINLWELFSRIGQAEKAYKDEAAGYLVSCLDSDPAGINYLRCRDESGVVLPMDMGARFHLVRELAVFASQATLFGSDGRPTDDAQPKFERTGFYASDIYPFLAHHDVAVSSLDDDDSEGRIFSNGRRVPRWMLTYARRDWISRSRAAKILLAGTNEAELSSPRYDEAFFRWDAALSDAIERGAIAVTIISRKQMLAHPGIRAWCTQHGYAWPFEAAEMNLPDDLDTAPSTDQQELEAVSGSKNRLDGIGAKRLDQIEAIEATADELGYPRMKIPKDGKANIRKKCKEKYLPLFGVGDDPFRDAWNAALKAQRIRTADHHKYARR